MSEIIINIADFSNDFSHIKMIRQTVFIDEQKVPEELEWDEFDVQSIHILAYYDGVAVGTARLLPDGHIGRMAVLQNYRNRKVGQSMLKYLLDIAKKDLNNKVLLSAQEQAVVFYQKQGFVVISDVYLDAGIPHFDMEYLV